MDIRRSSRNLQPEHDNIITASSDMESLYESYHSIFSYMTSEPIIYNQLMSLCGCQTDLQHVDANDYYFTNNFAKNKRIGNTIYMINYGGSVAHYIYINASKDILDPYAYYQFKDTHGNCFAYALYLAYLNNTNGNGQEILQVLPPQASLTPTPSEYKTFVANDHTIINWLLSFVSSHFYNVYSVKINNKTVRTNLHQEYTNEYDELKSSLQKRLKYGIQDKTFTFDAYFANFTVLANDIHQTYKMTKYAIHKKAAEDSDVDISSINLELYLGGGKRKSKSNKHKSSKHKSSKHKSSKHKSSKHKSSTKNNKSGKSKRLY